MKVYPLILISCLFACILPVNDILAQLYYRAETITTHDGLSDNRITSFLKDQDGFIWVGTRNGLNRYDGHSFSIFRPTKSNSISNETINDLAQDDQGNIWVATMSGLNRYDPNSNLWETIVPNATASDNDLPSFIAWDILTLNNKLWIASDIYEFSEYDPVKRKFTYYDWPGFAMQDKNLAGLSYRSIKKFVARNSYEFWLATTGGLVILDIKTRKFRFVAATNSEEVVDLKYDMTTGRVYLSSGNDDLLIYDETTNTSEIIKLKTQVLPSSQFRQNGEGEIWLGSRKGLVHIIADTRSIYCTQSVSGMSSSLLPGGVNTVFKDNSGISWLGTNNGINKYSSDFRQTAFLPLISQSDKEELNQVNSVYFDVASGDYFACAGELGKVFIIHSGNGQIKSISHDSEGKEFSCCNAVVTDSKKNIWLLTDKEVYRFDKQTEKFTALRMEGLRSGVKFKDMAEDTEGNFWFACFDGGIIYYNTRDRKISKLENPEFRYLANPTALHSDTLRKKMWIGTFSEGLFCYDLTQKKLTAYYASDSTPQYAPLSLVHDISQDSRGNIWVATHSGGIFRYEEGQPYSKSFRQFSMKDGLNSNNFISLCSDADTTLWLLSGQGIAAMSINGKFLYKIEDESTFNSNIDNSDKVLPHFIGFNNEKKQVLVGMGRGLLFLSASPQTLLNNYPVRITKVLIGNEAMPDSVLVFTSPAIPFSHNSISFEFVALEYASSSEMNYEYRMVGFEDKWVNAGTTHSANYQNLPPGKYIFQVRARDQRGNLSMTTDQFSFRIAPPLWRTSWFIAVVALLISGLFYTWISFLRQKIKEQKILNYFATSLYGQNTIDDVFWDVAKNCISQLRFEDCVIYQYEEKRNVLIQKAAYGDKNPSKHQILNPLEIPLGKGIVGAVGLTRKPEIVSNTGRDIRYIIDDRRRSSEIAVPVMVDGKLFGVIDSEHHQKHFYKRRHLKLLQKIADTCGIKISRYLVEERLRLKIARDLHDEMGSTLTSINIMSKVAMQQTGDNSGIHAQLKKIKEHSSRMMESMSDMVWAIDPSNDSFEKIVLRMKEFAEEILEPAGINYFFREVGSIQKIQLNPEQRKDIYLIFKEALNNAVKYSQASEINILLKQEVGMIHMLIIDNGKGFDKNIVHMGNGLRNMQSRAQTIKGILRVESIPGTGTNISLLIPIP